LKKLEAIEPVDPDNQRKALLDVIESEQKKMIRKEDVVRIEYYLTTGVEEYHFEPYPKQYLVNAKKRLPRMFLLKSE
jgi:hypothetical protein